MSTKATISQFGLGVTLGVLIACAPTKFTPKSEINSTCGAATNCVSTSGYETYTISTTVGVGKVDILFVNDNSASMSPIQIKLQQKFAGFIQNLNARGIDYRIAMTTTDVAQVSQKKLITFGNGLSYISKADANGIVLFNSAILRNETIECESLIKSYFLTFGSNFKMAAGYQTEYAAQCPSPDTRGIFTANLVVADNADSFMRKDASLNVILISNDDVRQGQYSSDPNFILGEKDTAASFINMMQTKYPTKYWDFNSIVVMDDSCKSQQTLFAQGQQVMDQSGPAISGGIGSEYMKLSSSPALGIDLQPRERGQRLDICQNDYAANFSAMVAQITDESRMVSLNCTSSEAPTVTPASVPYNWSGDKITFQHGSEGTPVKIIYRCYTGPH